MKEGKIIGIGITGLVGSKIVDMMPEYQFTNLSLETGVDITKPQTLDRIYEDNESKIVLHLAAKADVDACEKDKETDTDGSAYKINVIGTRNIAKACLETNKKLIYISTDFVFDGKNPPTGGYTEEDTPNPINWYAKTKFMGEEEVQKDSDSNLIIRIAYPYRREVFPAKNDFVHAILARLQKNQKIMAVTDHHMTPTYLDDIAIALKKLIQLNKKGIFHVTGANSETPYEASLKIAQIFNCDKNLISPTTREEFFKNRAPRPFNLTMNNAKIKKLGISMKTFTQGLEEIKIYSK